MFQMPRIRIGQTQGGGVGGGDYASAIRRLAEEKRQARAQREEMERYKPSASYSRGPSQAEQIAVLAEQYPGYTPEELAYFLRYKRFPKRADEWVEEERVIGTPETAESIYKRNVRAPTGWHDTRGRAWDDIPDDEKSGHIVTVRAQGKEMTVAEARDWAARAAASDKKRKTRKVRVRKAPQGGGSQDFGEYSLPSAPLPKKGETAASYKARLTRWEKQAAAALEGAKDTAATRNKIIYEATRLQAAGVENRKLQQMKNDSAARVEQIAYRKGVDVADIAAGAKRDVADKELEGSKERTQAMRDIAGAKAAAKAKAEAAKPTPEDIAAKDREGASLKDYAKYRKEWNELIKFEIPESALKADTADTIARILAERLQATIAAGKNPEKVFQYFKMKFAVQMQDIRRNWDKYKASDSQYPSFEAWEASFANIKPLTLEEWEARQWAPPTEPAEPQHPTGGIIPIEPNETQQQLDAFNETGHAPKPMTYEQWIKAGRYDGSGNSPEEAAANAKAQYAEYLDGFAILDAQRKASLVPIFPEVEDDSDALMLEWFDELVGE